MPFLRIRTCAPLVLAAAMTSSSLAHAEGPTKEETKRACIAASEQAQELRRTSKLQEARGQIAACMDPSCPGPVREDCAKLLTEVEAATPTIVLAVQDASGNDLSAVHVTMDGQAFAERLDGKPLPLDPGKHHFVFQAPGLPSTDKTLVIRQGEKDRRELIVLGTLAPTVGPIPAPTAAPTSVSPTPAVLPSPTATTQAAAPPVMATPASVGPTAPAVVSEPMALPTAPGAGPPTGVFVLGAIGVAGLLAGTITGVLAVSKASDLNNECPSGRTGCPASAQSDISGLHTMETATNVGLGIGIGGVVLAGIWWLASGHSEKAAGPPATAWIGVGSAGLAGSF